MSSSLFQNYRRNAFGPRPVSKIVADIKAQVEELKYAAEVHADTAVQFRAFAEQRQQEADHARRVADNLASLVS